MAMLTRRHMGLAYALILAIGFSARAADEATVLAKATALLEEISTSPDSGIPTKFLQEARGILIMPSIVTNQFGVGRMDGHGIFLSRTDKGEWGNPQPMRLANLSVGAEVGHIVTDSVVIYRTQKAADHYHGETIALALSCNVSGSLRHSSRFSGPKDTSTTERDTLVYTRKRGILVGARITGEHKSWPVSSAANAASLSAAQTKSVDAPRPTGSVTSVEAAGVPDHPEWDRLKRALNSLTAPPAHQVATKDPKDPQISPTSAARRAGSP